MARLAARDYDNYIKNKLFMVFHSFLLLLPECLTLCCPK